MIDPEQVRELFDAAAELPPGEDAVFLERECAGQPEILAQVLALLASRARADAAGFMRQTALDRFARQVARDLPRENRNGEMLGRYRMVRLLGAGGMGEVYLAEDTELARQVALKIIRSGVRIGRLLDHFERERRILAQLNHPNIARLLDAGTSASGEPFLVMEYVDGKPVTAHCDENGLPVTERLKLFRVICSAVEYAHRNVVVHRDLKPGNILVAAGGQVKLLDFGIAKLLDSAPPPEARTTLAPELTPEYASPEQVNGKPTSTATDVYSLGVVLYELLTGTSLYQLEDHSSGELLRAVCEQEPHPPSAAALAPRVAEGEGGVAKLRRRLGGDLDQIVLKALRKEPEARYASVEQFSADIARYLDRRPVAARRGALSYRAGKFVRRNRMAVIAAAAAGLTLIAGLVAITWEARVAIARGAMAQKRFAEARKLAHAILFDYHDSIADLPGSTLARQKLVTDALTYLNAVSAESAGDAGLRTELGAAYLRVGDVQGKPYSPNLGQTEPALRSYRQAVEILEPIARPGGGSAEPRRQLATGYERIGRIQLRKFQFPEALTSQASALEIRRELAARYPAGTGILKEVAASLLYWGDAMQATCFGGAQVPPCLQRALDSQRQAVEMFRELSRANPGDFELRRSLAEAYMRVGFRLRDLGTYARIGDLLPRALESQQNAMRIRDEIAAANPQNSRDRRNRADQRMLLADAQLLAGNRATAMSGYREAFAAFESLLAADPANAEARRDLSFSSFKLANALAGAGDLSSAFLYYDRSIGLARQLLAEDPNNAEDRQQVAGVAAKQSEAAEMAHDLPRATGYYAEYLSVTGPSLQTLYRLGELELRAALAPATPEAQRQRYWSDARDRMRACLQIAGSRGGENSASLADRQFWKDATRGLSQAEAGLSRR